MNTITIPNPWHRIGVGVGVARSRGNEAGVGVRIGQEPGVGIGVRFGTVSPRIRNPGKKRRAGAMVRLGRHR